MPKVDWCDLKQVRAVAARMPGTVVVKHPDRRNYNITHASRTDLYRPEWVVR